MRILIVDDSLDDRLLLETFLRKAGFSELTLADSAQDSFRQLGLEEPTREVYQVDLVLMDIFMPEIDGIEACRRIKASEQFSDVPIIMITAQTEMEYLRSAFDAGAIDYITKPVNKVELLARVSSALTLKREMDRRKAREQEIIDIGSEIQQTLLQGHPPQDFPGIGVAAFTMQSLRIGGDFYDFFKFNDRCLDIIIGDVMGKGIPAALMGAAIKNQFVRAINHLIAKEGIGRIPEPEEIVRRVHSELTAELIKLDSFVTLCYARVDLNGSRLSFVDCGHAKSLHFRQATKVVEISQVYVHPNYRRWGIATRLVNLGISCAQEQGAHTLLAEAPITNAVVLVYLKAGFRVSGFFDAHYPPGSAAPTNALFMAYSLD